MNMKSVFFYGLFMDPELLKNDGYNPGPLRIAQLKNYRLKLGSRATLIPQQSSEVWGTIINLPLEELAQLYSAPSVIDYQPTAVTCILQNGLEVEADVYILNPYEPLAPPTNSTYARKLATITKNIGLPLQYRQEIEDLIVKIEE